MTPIVTKDDPNGCFQRAMPDEPLFTLLARDKQAPALVRKWANDREAIGSPAQVWREPTSAKENGEWVTPEHPDAETIAHARYVAARMEVWRYENDGKWRNIPATPEPDVAPWHKQQKISPAPAIDFHDGGYKGRELARDTGY